MAVLKKTLFAENLDKYSVLIQDTDPNSKYFKITELPDTFTGGKNAFLIQGSEFLVADTIIKIEIKDSQGNIIYHEPGEGIPEYYEGTSKVIAVYVYPDTAFGPCTITILGEISEYEDSNGVRKPIPLQYKDTYNVRWQKQINVNPFLQNNTKIRFYRRPQVQISEVLKPVFTISETYVQQAGNAELFGNQFLGDLLLERGGQFFLPDDFQYKTHLLSDTFKANMLGTTMSFSSYPDYKPQIIELVSSTEAVLSEPLIENGVIQNIISTPYSITYLSGSDRTQSEFTSSYAQIKLTQLETFAGDVKRVKVFRRSKGSISDYELVQDILLESTELLITLEGTSRAVQHTGIFDSEILSRFWNTDGTLTATLSNARLVNGVKLNGAGKFNYSSSLDLSARTVYELQFDAFYSSSTPSNLEIYVSGSNHTNSSSIDETLIGTLNGIVPTKKFENQIVQFTIPVNEPSTSLYFSASQGEWHLSDLSLVVSQETAFSPDSVTFLTSIPTSIPNEIFEFKFEFYDVNNNFVPVTILEEKQFSGGTNTVIVLTQLASSSLELSGSIYSASIDLTNTINAVSTSISGTVTTNSASISGTIGQVSSSVSGTIGSVSASVSGSIFTLSGSVSGTIGSVSASVSGTIGVLSGSVSGTIGSVSASVSGTIGVLSGSVSGSIYTLSGSVSASISNVSSSISSSLSSANSQSLYTVFSASAYLDKFIFTDENGKLRRPPTASANGLYTGDDHLGFYSGGTWKTYMDSQGDFYLTSSAANGGFLAWSSTQGRLQIQGDINIQGGNAATNASLTSSLNAVSGAINSATQSLSSSVASTVFTTATGLIAKPPSVLVGSTSGLYLGSSFLGYYDGAGWKTFMANNGNFYLSGSGGDSLTWAGGILTINGAINITGGNAATSAALTSSLSSTLSSANSTALSYVNAATSSLSSSIYTTTQNLGDRIFTDALGRINKTPSTGTTAGLYLGSTNLGYYNGNAWKTYMDNTGLFYLTGSANGNALLWDGSVLSIKGAITVTGGDAATTTTVNTAASNAVTSGSNAAATAQANAISTAASDATTKANAAQTAAQLFASSAAGRAVDSGSAAATAAQTAAINQAKADASASINLLANGNWTAGTGTFITARSISSPVIAGNAGYISEIFKVGPSGITLDGGNKKIFIGANGNHNNTDTSFYVDNDGKMSLKNKFVWDGSTLSLEGAINITGGTAGSALTNLNAATSSVNTSISNINTTTSNLQTQVTAVGAYTRSIATNDNGLVTLSLPATPAGAGLYLGSQYLGYYNSGWKTYMDNSGNFYLNGTNGYLQWNRSSDTLGIKGDITATNITATNTGNLAGWTLTSDALSRTTGSFTLKLTSTSTSPGLVIAESVGTETFNRLRINSDLTIPAINVSDTGSINYSNGNQIIAQLIGNDPPGYTNGSYGPVLGDGGSNDYGTGYFGIIGLIYGTEEIFVEAEQFPPITSVLSGNANGDYVFGYWDCYLRVRRFPTFTDAINETNIDTTYGFAGEERVLLASSFYEEMGYTPIEYNNIYGGTIKAPGGGGINTPGTAKIYRVEIEQAYYIESLGQYSTITVRRPSDMIQVKFGRVGNGYSIFSPGGIQVYQGFRNYMNAANVAAKAEGLDEQAAAAVNFFEVKGKSGIIGSLSVSSGLTVPKGKQFKIQHPKNPDKWLYHTALESPRADLIYRGLCELNEGFASCSIDSASRMEEGTFYSFTKNPQLFLQNDSGFDRLKGNIFSGSIQIYSENNQSTDTVSWMVVAERNDKDITESPLYDKYGNYRPERFNEKYIEQKKKNSKNLVSGSI
jgi:hypothetical protein